MGSIAVHLHQSECLLLWLRTRPIVHIRQTAAAKLAAIGQRLALSSEYRTSLPQIAPKAMKLASKMSDSCHVEQKNWSVVRRLVGYDRYSSRTALEAFNRVYDVTRLYVNFFQPVMKLVPKTRHGAKVHKVYDTAQTPYQRLLKTGVFTEAKQQELAAIYHGLNPVLLLKQINENLERLWDLAEHPAHQQKKVKTYKVSVA